MTARRGPSSIARWWGRLRVRLVLLSALVALPGVAFILRLASEQRLETRRRVGAEAAQLARLASREHARQIAGARELLRTLPATRVAASPPAQCPELFGALLRRSPELANLGMLAPDGKLACSEVPPPGPVDMSGTPAYEHAVRSAEVEVGDYQIGLIVHRPVLVLARAVRGAEGALEGVAFGALDLGWFNQLAEQADLPAGSAFAIADRNGRILARSLEPARWIGTSLPVTRELVAAALRSETATEAVDVDGVRRLFALAPLSGTPDVFVTVGIPVERAFAAADRAMVGQVAGLSLVTLLAAAAASLGVEVLVLRGVRSLSGAARQLGAGDLAARAPEDPGGGEIGELAGTFNAMADALESRHAEAAAARAEVESSKERLRALSRRLEAAREEESARIARDLHDELGQSLTAIKMDLAWLSRHLLSRCGACAIGAEVSASVPEMVARVDATVDAVRRISAEIRPSVLDQLGLGAALGWQLREFEARTSIRCTLELGPAPASVEAGAATTLFRIFQEALTNVSRHAEATAVKVDLRAEAEALVLAVRDDGRGITPGEIAAAGSLGILGMRERAHLLGGSVIVEREAGGGTTVTARIPLAAPGSGGAPEC